MDMGIAFVRKAKTDAYILTTYKNRKLKTKVSVIEENGPPCDWNQEIWHQLRFQSSRVVL